MRRALITSVCVMAIAAAASAQRAPSAAAETGWTGEVTGTKVYVRSTPDSTSYPCLQLSKPAKVKVVGKAGDRFKILPPPEAFSIIAKSYVTLDASGRRGTVTGDNVRVRAGTRLYNWTRTIDHYAVQLRLNKGDQVTVVGQGEHYYKIAPPKGAFLYISEKYVRRAGATGQLDTATVTTTQPAGDNGDKEPPDRTESSDERKAELAELEALESKLKAEFEKPAEMRDLRSLLAEYRALDLKDKEYLEPYVESRIKLLENSLEHAKELQSLEEARRSLAAKQREFEAQRTRIEVLTTTRPAPTYAAKGILVKSAVFTGAAGTPERFVVRDPATMRITAYAQCTTGVVDLAKYEGKEVALIGTGEYNENLKVDLVEVKQVTVLREKVPILGPPEPVVKPYTPPPIPEPMPVLPQEPKEQPETTPPAPEPETIQPPPPNPKTEPVEANPEAEPSPAETKPEPEPLAAEPERPILEPEPAPTTRPGEEPPLPPTGLPLIAPQRPTTQPVNEKEFG